MAVNHSKEFVSEEGACTNIFEGLCLVENKIKNMHGLYQTRLDAH